MTPASCAQRRRAGQTVIAAAAALLLIASSSLAGGARAAPAPPPPQTPTPKQPQPTKAPAAPSPPAAPKPPSSLPPGELPPIYGNYCGYQNSTCEEISFRKAPVDELDAACKRHDACWCKNGRMDCSCDKELLESARALMAKSAGARGSGVAAPMPVSTAAMTAAVVSYFTIAPCVCRERKFCLPTCGARTGCTWGGPNCRQAVSPGLGGVCAITK